LNSTSNGDECRTFFLRLLRKISSPLLIRFNTRTSHLLTPLATSSSTGPLGSKYNPTHYQKGNIQVWDFIADQKLDYLKGCIVKYVCRAGSKPHESELDDLLKARAYLDKAISCIDTITFTKSAASI
jgi:hypothetical protein